MTTTAPDSPAAPNAIAPKTFAYSLDHGVATFTLNRPERLNSLTFDVYEELADVILSVNDHPEIRSVLVTGEGRGFCSGGDRDDIIAKLFSRDMSGILDFTRVTGRLIANFRKARRPIVAAVNGVAVGAGAVIAIACDVRIAADTARFGFIFPPVGLSGADMGAAYLLPRIVGLGRASELLFTGDIVDAQEAYRIGLVNRVVPAADCVAEARKFAERLASGPAFAHSVTKQMLESEHTMALDEAIEAEAQAQAICMMHPDFRTAFDAAMKKGKPTFQGAPFPLRGKDGT
ncbi:MAG: enoyl-CoA hydratase family protein [Polyangiaceae bacterium]